MVSTTTVTFNAESDASPAPERRSSDSGSQTKSRVLRPFKTSEVKVLLLEDVHPTVVEAFEKQGYQVKPLTDLSFSWRKEHPT